MAKLLQFPQPSLANWLDTKTKKTGQLLQFPVQKSTLEFEGRKYVEDEIPLWESTHTLA
jgi:hypothetical protein